MESKTDTFTIVASDPETPAHPVAVLLEQREADAYLMQGLLDTIMRHFGSVGSGGTMSFILTRGRQPKDDDQFPPPTTASFVLNNPSDAEELADRHSWDFRIERSITEPRPVPVPE